MPQKNTQQGDLSWEIISMISQWQLDWVAFNFIENNGLEPTWPERWFVTQLKCKIKHLYFDLLFRLFYLCDVLSERKVIIKEVLKKIRFMLSCILETPSFNDSN